MSFLVANLPPLKVYVKKEYLYDHQKGHGEFVEGVWVTVKSIQGRALYFETYLPEYGALYDKLPISAFVNTPIELDLKLEELELWERLDRRRYVGFEHDILLPWSYMEQAKDMSWTVPHHKTIIIHGISDDIVPIQSSRKISQMSDLIDLHEIEDNHRMKKSLQVLEEVVSTLMSS